MTASTTRRAWHCDCGGVFVSSQCTGCGAKQSRGTPKPFQFSPVARVIEWPGPGPEVDFGLDLHTQEVDEWMRKLGYDPRFKIINNALCINEDAIDKFVSGHDWLVVKPGGFLVWFMGTMSVVDKAKLDILMWGHEA